MLDIHGCQKLKITYKGSVYMQTKPINPTKTLPNETTTTNYQEPIRIGPLLALREQAVTERPLPTQGGSNNIEKQRCA